MIPAALKICPVQPEPPSDTADDGTFADWIVDLAGAGQSCRDNLTAVVKAIGQ